MMRTIRQYWPECLLALTAAFFFLRELGTFPEAWLDDSLFMIVARNMAEGKGYTFPVLDHLWWGSYFLAVGPTVILPSALTIKLFGFSIAAARIPMVLYLIVTTIAVYAYAFQIEGQRNARFAVALLVSFSAFVNTGKPVLGEIPSLAFTFAGLLCFERALRSWRWSVLCGIFLGLAFVTKTTMGLIFPALGVAWAFSLLQRNGSWKFLTCIGLAAVLTFLPFMPILGMTDPGWLQEILQYGAAEGGSGWLRVLREQPHLLLRFQYLYALGLLLPLASIGMIHARKRLSSAHIVFVAALAGLFLIYFLSERGFYRHLLPAHILIIPFLPLGAFHVLKKEIAAALLALFIALQGLWQLDHRGARRLNEAKNVVAVLEARYPSKRMVIEEPEVYVQLRANPNWLFLSQEFESRSYDRFPDLPKTRAEHCLPVVKKMSAAEQEQYDREQITPLDTRYVLLAPPVMDCTTPYGSGQ